MQRIAELTSGIARQLGMVHAQQQLQEDEDLNQVSLSQLGLPLDLVVNLSQRDLRLRCSSMGQIDPFRSATAGSLLSAAAAWYPERAAELQARSLGLLLLAIEENQELDIAELRGLAQVSVDALGADMPPALQNRAQAQGLNPR